MLEEPEGDLEDRDEMYWPMISPVNNVQLNKEDADKTGRTNFPITLKLLLTKA